MREIGFAYRTIYAELLQQSLDAAFDADFGAGGNFVSVPVKGKNYWYFDPAGEGAKRRYVGPADDAQIDQRVKEFRRRKDDVRGRRKLVSTLVREAGLPAPERLTGDIVEALAAAGLFRLRAVLVGTVAFQTYSAVLGVKLPSASMQTADADFAQSHAISAAVEDGIPSMLDALQRVDPTFRAVPDRSDSRRTTRFVNAARYQVEFLTPNTGGADNESAPSAMPSLGGASAQPLRFLDYLIREPIRAVLLHKSGVPVLVPTPERFAIHKLIVASRRVDDANGHAKRDKDVAQSGVLIEALAGTRRQSDLASALIEAWDRGKAWQRAIALGLGYLPGKWRLLADATLREGLHEIGESPSRFEVLFRQDGVAADDASSRSRR